MVTERIPGPALPTENPTSVRLGGPGLALARAVWIALVGAIVVLTVIGLQPGYQAIQRGADEEAIVPHGIVMASLAANGIPAEPFVIFDFGGMVLMMLVSVACGVFIFWKRSDEVLALLLSLAFISLSAATGTFLENVSSAAPGLAVPAVLLTSIGIMLVFPLLALFPDGRLRPRWVIAPTLIWAAVVLIYVAAEVFLLGEDSGPDTELTLIDLVIFGCIMLPLLSFPIATIYRYRRIFSPVQRQQTKLVVYAGVVLVIGLLLNFAVGTLTKGVWQAQRGSVLPVVVEVVGMLATLPGMLGLPIAVVVAMQRYRLWDVDFLINRSLVIGGLTVLLAGVFAGAFFGLNAALAAILGGGQTALAAAAATLILVVLFTPARRAVARFVDRRFYGIQVNYSAAGKRSAPAVAPGGTTSFGEYSGLTLLGRGGMGEVYLGQHPTLGRSVAIKILPGQFVPDENARQRFLREAQLVAKLKHPNIVSIYDFGEHDGVPYMIMEYIDGKDLGTILKERGPLPVGEALPLLGDIASALDFIHENGIVHRDVKPSNILIEKVSATNNPRKSRAVLTDFGIARVLDVTTHLTQGGMIGTLDYISPEQIQGASKVDHLADVYSFGVLAYHVLTGELPFRQGNPGAMVLAHMMTPPPDPRELNPALSQKAADAVMQAMNKKPEQRFATATEFAQALG